MTQKHWINEIYRGGKALDDDIYRVEYIPQKLTRRGSSSLLLPHEVIKFLGPHWNFIKKNTDILDTLEHPECYDFVDIIDILSKIPKENDEATSFLRACMRFGYTNKKILRIFDIPNIIPPQVFRRFLPEVKLSDWHKEKLSTEDEIKVRRLYPDIRWDFWSNYTEAGHYGRGHDSYQRVFQQENSHRFAQVQSNGVSVLSQSIFSRYEQDYKTESIARGKSPLFFLNQGFTHPHTDINDIKREQELLTHIIEHPEIERLLGIFKESSALFRNYSMLLYPIEGNITHEGESYGRSIRDLYHLARYRKVREKNEMQELNQELAKYGVTEDNFAKVTREMNLEEIPQDDLPYEEREVIRLYKAGELTSPEDQEFVENIIARYRKQKEDDTKKSEYRYDIFKRTMDIYDPEDPYGTQAYCFERYPDWVKSNNVFSRSSYVDLDLLQALEDGLAEFEMSVRGLREFFSHFPKESFPHFNEVETQLRVIETYFGKKYLFRESDPDMKYRSYYAESHVSSSPEHGNLKELDMFLQNLGIIGGLIELVDVIRTEGWSKTNLGGTQGNSYSQAWNLGHEKVHQVTESLAHNGTVKVFSSANTSGKSYLLKRDALVHMAMQGFGYAPAQSSELTTPMNAFFFFDRPDNQNIEALFEQATKKYGSLDSSIQKFFSGVGNPSAFMMEALSLTMQLRSYIPGSLIYLDEVFTTTSALDQAALLCALLEYFHMDKNQIILATHNELLLKYLESGFEGFPVELLHLGYTQTPAGLKNTYKIESGRGDSLFLDVAKREQSPKDLIDQAKNYFSGDISFSETKEALSSIPVTYYTPEERETLSQEVHSIMQLFSKANPNSILKLYSKNQDIASALQFPRAQRGREEHRDDYYESLRNDPRYYGLLIDLLFHTEFQSSQETLERQQLFSELVEKCDFEKLSDILNRLSYFDDAMKQLEQKKINADVWGCLFVQNAEDWKKKVETTKKESAATFEKLKDGKNLFSEKPYTSLLESADLKKLGKILELNAKILGNTQYFEQLKEVLERLINITSDDTIKERAKKIIDKTIVPESKTTEIETQNDELKEIIELENKFTPLLIAYLEKLSPISYSEFLKNEHRSDIEEIITYGKSEEDGKEEKKIEDTKEEALKEKMKPQRKVRKGPRIGDAWDALYYVGNFPVEVAKLVQELTGIDSIYIKQSLNFLEEQAKALQNGTFVYRESTYWRGSKKSAGSNFSSLSQLGQQEQKDNFGLSHISGVRTRTATDFKFENILHNRRNTGVLYTEVLALSTLVYWAHTIKIQKLTKVTFSEEQSVKISGLRHLNFLASKESIPNDFSLTSQEQVRILTGPNGSGKTFHEQSVILGILSALSSGYCPAEAVKMPLFDSLIYLERVMEQSKEGLSAGANELRYWKEIWQEMESAKNPFVCFDELFSTTSPRYQEAFSFSVLHFLKKKNILGILSTHNHDLISKISGAEELFPAYHFSHSLSETGEIVYSRHIERGHAPSLGIEVAEKMGFDKKIIQRAKEIRELLLK